ncbi:ribonuclease PH [bacterium]|nr:ribonuclease PH [bacterium]
MRKDGRKNNELRPVKFTKNFTKNALGSVLVEFGDTKVITTASVEMKQPKWMDKDLTQGWITAEYSLLPSSTSTRCERERTKLSGRTQEIQRLIGRSIRACVDLEKMPKMTITIDADVIQADGGTRTASICGGFMALQIAVEKLIEQEVLTESPIKEEIAAISVGIVDGDVRLDLCYEEDSNAQVDSNVVMTKSGKIIEFQTTAEGDPYDQEQLMEIFNTAKSGIETIFSLYNK